MKRSRDISKSGDGNLKVSPEAPRPRSSNHVVTGEEAARAGRPGGGQDGTATCLEHDLERALDLTVAQPTPRRRSGRVEVDLVLWKRPSLGGRGGGGGEAGGRAGGFRGIGAYKSASLDSDWLTRHRWSRDLRSVR